MAVQQQQQACVLEVLDAPAAVPAGAADSERDRVLGRVAEREEQRTAMAARRLEELEVSADPRESVDAFLQDFSERRRQLEAQLREAAGLGTGTAELGALAEQIAELEKAVADATYFLPAYDLRQATLALSALREQQEMAAAALQPRKRFAFNRKAAAPEAAAALVPTGTAASSDVVSSNKELAREPASQGPASYQPQQDVQQPAEQQVGAAINRPINGSSQGSTISGLRGQVVILSREDASGKEFTLSDLEDCTIFLLAPLAALFMHGLRRCKVYTGPVAGACFVEGAASSTLMIAARQVRIHSAADTDFYLRVRSHPIIEHSGPLRFAPYEPAYPGSQQDLEEQGLAEDSAMWCQVNDFGWLRATPSPHWSVLPEEQRELPAEPPAAAA